MQPLLPTCVSCQTQFTPFKLRQRRCSPCMVAHPGRFQLRPTYAERVAGGEMEQQRQIRKSKPLAEYRAYLQHRLADQRAERAVARAKARAERDVAKPWLADGLTNAERLSLRYQHDPLFAHAERRRARQRPSRAKPQASAAV